MGGGNSYNQQEIAIIKKYYAQYGASGPKGCTQRIFDKLGIKRLPKAIKQKARRLGISYQGEHKGHFKKGMIPWNKGKPMSPEYSAKCAPYRFGKGHKPANTKYDGAISKSQGYWQIRISEGNWVALNRWIYQNYYNVSLTSQDVIKFKDGNRDNLNIDNLQRVSRCKNLLLNNPKTSYMSEELMEVIETYNKLKKTINNHGKK